MIFVSTIQFVFTAIVLSIIVLVKDKQYKSIKS